jgi:hypothetical protein
MFFFGSLELGEFRHGAAFHATDQFLPADTTRSHAGAIEHDIGVPDDTADHGFDVVIHDAPTSVHLYSRE